MIYKPCGIIKHGGVVYATEYYYGCSKCNRLVDRKDMYCRFCGHKFKKKGVPEIDEVRIWDGEL